MSQRPPSDDLRIDRPDEPSRAIPQDPSAEAATRRKAEPDWARDALLDMARHGLIEQRRSRRWKVFFRLASVALLVWSLTLMTLLFTSGKRSAPSLGKPAAAVIDITGLIAAGEPTEARRVIPQLEKAFKQENIKGIVLRLNTPGGSPVQSSAIFNAILELKAQYPDKPVYAVAEDMAASGGYFIAAAADEIYANPSSIVGSIGVRMDSFGFVDAMEKLGIERRLLTAGDHKALGDPFSPADPEETAYLKGILEEIHAQFIAAVKAGRGDRLADDDMIFSGRFYTGETAMRLGLTDGMDSVRGVILNRVGVKEQVDFTPRRNRLEQLLGMAASDLGSSLFGMARETATPMMLP
ncbi:MAG TPA: S49 family peptidase [Guyparkeria sp.]|nr:S49 family peptidase [Guyparkeria sp.]